MTGLLKPPALRPGDLVGLCAPSGVVDADSLAPGVAALEALGLRAHVPEDMLSARDLFMAGSVERRVAELHALLDDPDVAGIVCVRGGAGALQLLGRLDVAARAAHPKVLLGYSDVTALHVAFGAAGWATFHGPMLSRDFATGLADLDSFRAVVMGEDVPTTIAGPLVTLREGAGEGRLVGGCLSLLSALAGTPWALRPQADTLLFIEDWNEAPYRLERMLWQLRASGAFARVRGVAFGEMLGCDPRPGADYRLEQVLSRALEGLDVPVAFGLSSGHTQRPNRTLALGVRARLTCAADGAWLEPLEAGVEARA